MKPISPDDAKALKVRLLGQARLLGPARKLGNVVRKLGEKREAPDLRPLDEQMRENIGEVEGFLARTDHELTVMEKIDAALANETETDYWCCLVFQTSAQRAAFLKAFQMDDDAYVDGEVLAARVGVAVPARPVAWKTGKVSERLAKLALPV